MPAVGHRAGPSPGHHQPTGAGRRGPGLRAYALLAGLTLAIAGCSEVLAPTNTTERISLHGCPGGKVHAERRVHFTFTVRNTSAHRWAAGYLLLQPAGPIQTAMTLPHGSRPESIGGYVTRVRAGLAPGHALSGQITAALNRHGSASFKLGAWGAPGNSVAEPSPMPARYCTLSG